MKREIKNMYVCALLLVLLSCGSGGSKSGGSSTLPTPSTPIPLTPSEPVIGVNDVYYDNAIVIREKYFRYLPENPNNINNSMPSNTVEKIPNIIGNPITKQDYQTSAGIPMNEKIFLHSTGTSQQVTEFSSDLIASNSYRTAIGADLMDEYIARVNSYAGNNLYIWPSGDIKENKNPSLQGGLPYFENSLIKSWINVVALANKPGTTGLEWKDLEPLSNAGVAKSWTITAVSEDGTSAKAAENVATVAGQLYEKFPGMKMEMIRQIILSTATDIGALGTDDIFGIGLLNGAKALGGPVYINDKIVVPASKTWEFSNYIRGGKLEKEGAGKLILKGDTGFYSWQNTEINGGILDIRGRHSSGIKIGSAGTLITNSNTKIGKDVINKGILKNVGKGAIIEGNYTAEYGSVTEAEIGTKLIVKGTVKIDGRERNQALGSTLRVLNNNYVTAAPTTATVIEAEKGIEGKFEKVETDELINGKVENKGNLVEATISRKNVEDYVNNLSNSDETQKNTAKNVEVSFKELDKKIEEGNTDVSEFALSAAKFQKKIILEKIPEMAGLSLGAWSVQNENVCGDYYDILAVRKDRTLFVMADVVGKGMNSFSVMVMIRTMLRMTAATPQSPAAILKWINRGLCAESGIEDHFASIALIDYNPLTKETKLSTSGINPVLVYTAKTDEVSQLSKQSEPLGVEKTSNFADEILQLERGDILVTCTDGLLECLSESGVQYSASRLMQVIKENHALAGAEIAERVKADVKRHSAGAQQYDDQSLLIIKIK